MPCDARRRSGAPFNEPAIHGWSKRVSEGIASAVARTQQKNQGRRRHEATNHGWRVRPPGPPKVRRASQGPQGFRPEGVAARDGCESAACAGCALGRLPGGPRSAGHRAPGRRAADRRGCVGGAGGLAQARSPARAAEAARNALSLATTKQPRTQDARGKIETWRSRASALLQVKQRRETLCRLRRQNNPRGKTPAARSRRCGRAQARSYGRGLARKTPAARSRRGGRAQARSYGRWRRETLCRLRGRNNLARKTPAARSAGGGRAARSAPTVEVSRARRLRRGRDVTVARKRAPTGDGGANRFVDCETETTSHARRLRQDQDVAVARKRAPAREAASRRHCASTPPATDGRSSPHAASGFPRRRPPQPPISTPARCGR